MAHGDTFCGERLLRKLGSQDSNTELLRVFNNRSAVKSAQQRKPTPYRWNGS